MDPDEAGEGRGLWGVPTGRHETLSIDEASRLGDVAEKLFSKPYRVLSLLNTTLSSTNQPRATKIPERVRRLAIHSRTSLGILGNTVRRRRRNGRRIGWKRDDRRPL